MYLSDKPLYDASKDPEITQFLRSNQFAYLDRQVGGSGPSQVSLLLVFLDLYRTQFLSTNIHIIIVFPCNRLSFVGFG